MRPGSLFSAALCGVLWASLNLIVNAVAQLPQATSTIDAKQPQSSVLIAGGAAGSPVDTTITSTTALLVQSTAVTDSTTAYTSRVAPSIQTTVPTEAATVSSVGSTPEASSSANTGGANIGAIVGGVVGGIIIIILIGVGAFLLWRRRRKSSTSRDAFGGLEKNRESSSPSVYPTPPPHAISYDPPVNAPPQSATSGEGHALMSSYPDTQPQQGEVVPVVGAQKPYVVGATEREVDEDGVSLRCPSPTVPEEGAEQGRDFVPRLPIYNRGSDESPRGPAL